MIRPAFDGALFAFGFTLLTAGSALGQFLPVADTSAMVPGGATGEVFLSFSGGSTSLSGSAVAFRGTGDMGTQGVYTDVGGALSPVADTATIVPGGAPGETFSSFGNGRPSLAGGSVTFQGNGDMGTQGIYTDFGGMLAAVADTATAVPGGAPGELFSSFAGVTPSLSVGNVVFTGIGDMGTQGIYTDFGGVLAAVADTATAVPGGAPGEVFSFFFGGPSLSDGSVAFSGTGDLGTSGIYTDLGGALAAVADSSTAVPGGAPGEVFSVVFGPSISGGSVAFRGTGNMGTWGVYTTVGGVLTAVADSSTTVPGGAPGEVFSVSPGITSISGSSVTFVGTGDLGTQGVYTDVGGALAAVADTATAVPGGGPGEVFLGFSVSSLSGGRVAFVGTGDMGTQGIYLTAAQPPGPTEIPTLGSLGIAALALVLAAVALAVLRRPTRAV